MDTDKAEVESAPKHPQRPRIEGLPRNRLPYSVCRIGHLSLLSCDSLCELLDMQHIALLLLCHVLVKVKAAFCNGITSKTPARGQVLKLNIGNGHKALKLDLARCPDVRLRMQTMLALSSCWWGCFGAACSKDVAAIQEYCLHREVVDFNDTALHFTDIGTQDLTRWAAAKLARRKQRSSCFSKYRCLHMILRRVIALPWLAVGLWSYWWLMVCSRELVLINTRYLHLREHQKYAMQVALFVCCHIRLLCICWCMISV